MAGRIPWSSLPEHLLTKIGQCLDARFDIIRFRSVCSTWRNSLPFSLRNWHHQLPLYRYPHPDEDDHIMLPFNGFSDPEISDSEFSCSGHSSFILRITVYILKQHPVSSPISTPWLLKLEETEQGKLRILNPISDTPFLVLPTTFPKVLNLLDYPILEVSRGYINKDTIKRQHLEEDDESADDVSTSFFEGDDVSALKVVILPESHRIGLGDDFMFLILGHSGELLLGRNGDERLTRISADEFLYDDIAVYKGRFFAIDRSGIVSCVDSSSSELIQYTPPILNGGHMKHLVVSSDHLYAVDRYFYGPLGAGFPDNQVDAKVASFKVYKLDEDGEWWTEITSLEDRILFIGKALNFFVPIKDLSGCRGNYIFFLDEKDELIGSTEHFYNDGDEFIGSTERIYDDEDDLIRSTCHDGISVFDMVDQRIGKLSSFPGCSDMVWSPPSWFTSN